MILPTSRQARIDDRRRRIPQRWRRQDESRSGRRHRGGRRSRCGRPCAAIVDANIANPDAWGQLNLPPGAATVRDMIVALPPTTSHRAPCTRQLRHSLSSRSREKPPNIRGPKSAARRTISARYPLVVVDMSNRLPDPTAGPEAAAAAYWLEHADVLVLPSAASKQDFNGVLDYLDVRDLPPVIVASLVRGARTASTAGQALHDRDRATRIPRRRDPGRAERVRYAGMEGVPVETVRRRCARPIGLAEAIAGRRRRTARTF